MQRAAVELELMDHGLSVQTEFALHYIYCESLFIQVIRLIVPIQILLLTHLDRLKL